MSTRHTVRTADIPAGLVETYADNTVWLSTPDGRRVTLRSVSLDLPATDSQPDTDGPSPTLMSREVASLIVRQETALGYEGIGPRRPTSGWNGKLAPDREDVPVPDGTFDSDEEQLDADILKRAYEVLGLDPDLDYTS